MRSKIVVFKLGLDAISLNKFEFRFMNPYLIALLHNPFIFLAPMCERRRRVGLTPRFNSSPDSKGKSHELA